MTPQTRPGYGGTGPGAFTPDGCSVDLYTRLPVGEEPRIIADAAPPGARLLELGCGAGRMTHPLLERGLEVTAVDESAEMLTHVRGARTVHASIEDLDLGERFDVVTLASFLVHSGLDGVRDRLLATCRRHVRDDGCVLIQREGADYHSVVPRERVLPGGLTIRIAAVTPVGDGVDEVRTEYVWPDAVWTQTFLSRELTHEEFERHLAAAGLAIDRILTDDGIWVRAVPAG
ncbi:class I SAM-dependent methyltransferase [Streptomyces triticagri]|uniref:Class I SAM-dependent methyltransferase n=1 Tax=Streptomyces triticagri TaxID=2293568 RepID=A0A372M2Y2_9ACTN|nr:class I SAM-dependent methyltransferase [Streptomyces triticagri]RFU85261.1 class I SAM-dependent methyltransferase [Streptomyces triticagri]